MSDDLNEFLRQAALRREARKRQSGSNLAPVSQPPNIPPSSRTPKVQEALEVLQPIPVEQRHLTPHIPPADHLSGNVAKVDQKREAHLREVFGEKPSAQQRSAKKRPKITSSQRPGSTMESLALPENPAMSDHLAAPLNSRKSMSSAEVLAFLRNPESLKMAFIASEIFGRKFQ